MDKYRVGFIIPAFNEENTISDIVTKVSKYGSIIVVDDGSTDKTALFSINKGAIVVSHQINLGYEEALNSGFKKAYELGFDVVMTIDADGQHAPKLISLFLDKITEGSDIVLGVRNKIPRVSEYIFSLYSYFKFQIKDPLCGMKAYKIDVYKKLGYFDSYKSVGSELAFYGVKNNYKVSQVCFQVRDRKDDSRYGNKIKANIRILKALLKTIYRFRK